MSQSVYNQGDLVDCPMTFKDESGVLVDPGHVWFNFQCGSFGVQKIEWDGSSTSPATGTVWKTGTGNYTARVDTTPFYGQFNGAGIGTGVGQAVGPISFLVAQNPLLP